MRDIPTPEPCGVIAVHAYEYSLRACDRRIEERARQHNPGLWDQPLWFIEDPQEIEWILMSHR